MQRESFGSRLGFLLVSAGCAIGIGNVWRFPYITGKNGGGYFVLFYLVCLLLLGVPVMTMELAVGRGGRKSAVLAYKNLEKPGSKWHLHGWFCLAGCYLLMMYYTTVTGWMVNYFGKFLTGGFHAGMTGDEISGMFGTKRGGQVWIKIFPDKSVTMRAADSRMGSGKGTPEYWVAVVKPQRVMFEIAGVPEEIAREALRLASHKLPIKTKIVARTEEAGE